ncbi:Nif3-like dinuclear metal center hexameric protein [Soehngenia saccharolytica]|nr:Nif3-like dinuclear metal center hexameric protein [Soehngenia saccharolytica]
MLVGDIINVIENYAPLFLSEEWDNPGLQVGSLSNNVNKVLLSLDLTEGAIKKAIDNRCELIITHHPLLFNATSSIDLSTTKGKLIENLIKANISVYSAHTNLDLTIDGVNDILANLIGIKNTRVLKPTIDNYLYKIVVYVPKTHEQQILKALSISGAGFIGNYSDCSFSSIGIGRFKPLEGSNPFIGELNKVEEVEEVRIEAIVTKEILHKTIFEVKKSHPYEEVALDIFKLENPNEQYGYGRVGDVDPLSLNEIADIIKLRLETENLIVYCNKDIQIRRVAVCGGSGSDFIVEAKKENADLYLTSDIKYHDAQLAKELDLILIDAGHYYTEKPVLKKLREVINKKFGNQIECIIHQDPSYCYNIL